MVCFRRYNNVRSLITVASSSCYTSTRGRRVNRTALGDVGRCPGRVGRQGRRKDAYARSDKRGGGESLPTGVCPVGKGLFQGRVLA